MCIARTAVLDNVFQCCDVTELTCDAMLPFISVLAHCHVVLKPSGQGMQSSTRYCEQAYVKLLADLAPAVRNPYAGLPTGAGGAQYGTNTGSLAHQAQALFPQVRSTSQRCAAIKGTESCAGPMWVGGRSFHDYSLGFALGSYLVDAQGSIP